MSHAEGNEGHVKFKIDSEHIHRSAIGIQTIDEGNIQAHVGFLQLNHKYELTLSLRLPHPAAAYEVQPQPSLAIRKISATASGDDPTLLLVAMEFLAHKRKLLRERVLLVGPGQPGRVIITICARVLGPDQGTPMLLDGVKQIGVVPLEESDFSDWQGFD